MSKEWPVVVAKNQKKDTVGAGENKGGVVLRESERKILDFLMFSDAFSFTIAQAFKAHDNGHDRVDDLKEGFKKFMNNDTIDGGTEIGRKLDECADIEDKDKFVDEVSKIISPIVNFVCEQHWKDEKNKSDTQA